MKLCALTSGAQHCACFSWVKLIGCPDITTGRKLKNCSFLFSSICVCPACPQTLHPFHFKCFWLGGNLNLDFQDGPDPRAVVLIPGCTLGSLGASFENEVRAPFMQILIQLEWRALASAIRLYPSIHPSIFISTYLDTYKLFVEI